MCLCEAVSSWTGVWGLEMLIVDMVFSVAGARVWVIVEGGRFPSLRTRGREGRHQRVETLCWRQSIQSTSRLYT